MARTSTKPIQQTAPTPPARQFKVPTATTVPSAGRVDSIGDALGAVVRSVSSIPAGDEFRGDLLPPLTRAQAALEDIRRDHWALRDQVERGLLDSREVIANSAQNAAANLATSGWESPGALEGARASARANAQRSALATIKETAIMKQRGTLDEHALEARTALSELSDKVDWAVARFAGPLALRGSSSIEDLHRISATVNEIKAAASPMQYCLDYLAQVRKNADAHTIDLFCQAAREVALSMRDTPEPRIATRWAGVRGNVSPERELAWDVLKALDNARAQAAPASLTIASDALAAMRGIFARLVGVDARNMSANEFAQKYLNGNGAQNAHTKLEIDLDWPARYLPGGPAGELPGWSSVQGRTSLGTLVRS